MHLSSHWLAVCCCILHIFIIVSLIIIRVSAVAENCFSMLHPAAICCSSTASTPCVTCSSCLHARAVLLTSLRAAASNGLGHWLWPRWSSGCHWHQLSCIQSPSVLFIWRYLRFVDVGTLVNCSCQRCTFEVVKERILSGREQLQQSWFVVIPALPAFGEYQQYTITAIC